MTLQEYCANPPPQEANTVAAAVLREVCASGSPPSRKPPANAVAGTPGGELPKKEQTIGNFNSNRPRVGGIMPNYFGQNDPKPFVQSIQPLLKVKPIKSGAL